MPALKSRVTIRAAVLAACFASLANAQQAPKKTSSIVGIAIDSLHMRGLSGAEVMVDGISKTAITDSLGRFRFDSIAPGRYQVGIFHPLLDSLGISLATAPFALGPDSTSIIRVAVPSAATLIAQTCKARPRQFGHSAIFGRLMDPDTFEPIAGAEVSVAWTEYEVSKVVGIRQTPRLVKDSTDQSGAFSLCGLPPELDARLQANYHGAMTADVPIATAASDGDVIIRPLYVSPTDTAAIKSGKAVVNGRVTFAGGQPAPGSRVEIVGSTAVALTNEAGDFSLANAPTGTQLLLVRHLGYTPEAVAVDLNSREAKKVAIKLQKYIPTMDPVLVTARREKAMETVGFTQRQRSGLGRYLTAEDIAKRNPFNLTDVLRTIPGLTVRYNGQGEAEVTSTRGSSMSGGSCVSYVVDGFRWNGGGVDQFVMPQEVAGIEVYQGANVPAEFATPLGGDCTTIVIWTKMKVGAR